VSAVGDQGRSSSKGELGRWLMEDASLERIGDRAFDAALDL
jgi:hypothetical protein